MVPGFNKIVFHTTPKPFFQSLSSHLIPKLNLSTTANISIKKLCVDLLKQCKHMPHFKQIQTQLFINGIHQQMNVLHKLIAFASSVSLSYTEAIFSRIEFPSLFIYNVMIKANAKMGQFRRAGYLFDELRMQGLCPDNYTYPFVIKSIGELKLVSNGEKIHGFVMKTGILYDVYVSNSILDMYGQFGFVCSLQKLFDEMPLRDLVSWNVMISGFVKSKQYKNALGVYMCMRQETSMIPDEATIVSTLSACTALKRLDVGREIHEYVLTQLHPTVIIKNALLDMFAKCGQLDTAREIFDSILEKNMICYTSMVTTYINIGQLENARMLFEMSPCRDLILWTAMINGYVQYNQVGEALNLFQKMQMDRVKPDKFTLVALLTGCAQSGALEQGEWIHAYLDEAGIPIDFVVGTAVIEMYAKCGCLKKALTIFYSMKRKDRAAWTSIICALAMNGNINKALELFSEMTEAGIRPDDITFIGVLNACSHGGLVQEGKAYFDSMKRIYKIEPKLEHYGCLIDLLGRAGLLHEAEEIIMTKLNIKHNKIVIPIFGALLSACRNYENVEIAERVAKRLTEIESSGSSGGTLLASAYASASRWDDASRVRREMAALGVKKLPGCSA